MQPERRRASDGAHPLPPVRNRADVRARGGEPEAAEIFLERSVDLSGLQLLALRLFDIQLGLLGDLRFRFRSCLTFGFGFGFLCVLCFVTHATSVLSFF